MNEPDLAPFGRDAFERAARDELPGMCERLARALAEMRRRGRTEDEVIHALRGVGHGLWSFDADNSVWCGNWEAPAAGGELIVEGVGESWCRVSWRAKTADPLADVHSATFEAKDASRPVERPTSASKAASEWYLFAAGAARVSAPGGTKVGSDRFAAHSGFAAVADGGGSFSGGGLAAEIATDVVINHYRRKAPSGCCPSAMAHVHGAPYPGSGDALRDDVSRSLKEAVVAADEAILAASKLDETYRGMGTTLCVALVCQGRLFFAHIGDSRLYHVHAGRVQQLTRDHVLPGHPGVVTHGLGHGGTGGLQTGTRPVEPGDQIVLATAGLHQHLSPEAILRALDGCETSRLKECAEALLSAASTSDDHATCIVGLIA